VRANGDELLESVGRSNGSESSCEHDRLVVTSNLERSVGRGGGGGRKRERERSPESESERKTRRSQLEPQREQLLMVEK